MGGDRYSYSVGDDAREVRRRDEEGRECLLSPCLILSHSSLEYPKESQRGVPR